MTNTFNCSNEYKPCLWLSFSKWWPLGAGARGGSGNGADGWYFGKSVGYNGFAVVVVVSSSISISPSV